MLNKIKVSDFSLISAQRIPSILLLPTVDCCVVISAIDLLVLVLTIFLLHNVTNNRTFRGVLLKTYWKNILHVRLGLLLKATLVVTAS